MFNVILVSRSWNGKRSLKFKHTADTRAAANQWLEALLARSPAHVDADYRVLGPVQTKALQVEIKAEQDARRAKGAQKAAATRKKRGAAAFIRCPHCSAKSKLLRSEMGGLQTRRCQNGHAFEYDKWLADRAFWRFIL